ncbi:ATP-dependent DNA helicase [candidate division WOR-3 bacterium]|nr:ATP-dependent DNA helicase [candidate division WOR-3 bacterium]
MKRVFSTSVRELVEYTLRAGDLDLSSFGGEHPAHAVRVHQSIQRARPAGYVAEVVVRHEVATGNCELSIGGRIDGVYSDGTRVVVDEIKTTRRNLARLQQEENPVHWGQAKCYAYIYAVQNDLEEIAVQLTYYQMEEEKTVEVQCTFSIAELSDFFDRLVSGYVRWIDMVTDWTMLRDSSIGEMRFPFENFRPGQEQMIRATAAAIEEGAQLLMQAPTGIGKTMAVIYAAMQALAQRPAGKVFYLTARTTGRNAAEQALQILRRNGLHVKSLSLVAKEKLCFNPEKACNGMECAYARGFYDRINDALRAAFDREMFTREAVLDIAREHRVCPFEFSLELSLWVDVVICDYNYVFDPRVYLRRFFENGDSGHILLVDEAHNLVDRAREMYSAVLHKQPVLQLRRKLKGVLPQLFRGLGKLNSWMVRARRELPGNGDSLALQECRADLCRVLRQCASSAEQWLSRNEKTAFREDLLDIYFEFRRFLSTAERYDNGYATCYSRDEKNFSVTLFCIDPSDHLRIVLERCGAAIFLSATLTPVAYFRRLFGCREDAETVSLPSPFPAENFRVLIAGRISALYRYREFTKHEVARMISVLIDQKKGNYLIFFPSYEYMRMVHEVFQERRPRARIIMQRANMSEKERDDFLACFNEDGGYGITGFVVMGGFFAESIDLVGERLTGAAIIGVGFPKISFERELIREYFDRTNGSGYAFAYQVPGMIKVLQAAGRVIRSEEDRGVVMLIDTRYPEPPYRMMLPEEWRPVFVLNAERASSVLEEFWRE